MKHGFTLIELMVVVSILAILGIIAASTYSLQHQRGLDARRKADLASLKIAFEDYYNDKGCYPSAAAMTHCEQKDLVPYLDKVPCDPGTHQPYAYFVNASCTTYGVLTTLQDTNDPIIPQLGCFPTCLQGLPYNFGVTNGSQSLSQVAAALNGGGGNGTPVPTPQPTATPSNNPGTPGPATPTPIPGNYACDPSGNCNYYNNPSGSGCPLSFASIQECQATCGNPANRCPQ